MGKYRILDENLWGLKVVLFFFLFFFFSFFLIVCFSSYFVFSIAVLPHSPGVVYYHLLLRRETRINIPDLIIN